MAPSIFVNVFDEDISQLLEKNEITERRQDKNPTKCLLRETGKVNDPEEYCN